MDSNVFLIPFKMVGFRNKVHNLTVCAHILVLIRLHFLLNVSVIKT